MVGAADESVAVDDPGEDVGSGTPLVTNVTHPVICHVFQDVVIVPHLKISHMTRLGNVFTRVCLSVHMEGVGGGVQRPGNHVQGSK